MSVRVARHWGDKNGTNYKPDQYLQDVIIKQVIDKNSQKNQFMNHLLMQRKSFVKM